MVVTLPRMESEETQPEPAPTVPAPASSKPAWIVAGVATAVALIAAMVAVSAVMREDDNANKLPAGMQAARFNRPVAGEITSIDGTSFKVNETFPNGDSQMTTVKTDRDTTFRESVDGSVGDLAVGDTVAVSGTTDDDVFTATRITETATQANVFKGERPGMAFEGGGERSAPPRVFQAGPGNMRIGEITKVEGDTITLAALDGTSLTVKTTAATDVRINEKITLASLKKGDEVRVIGSMSDDEIVASEVTRGALDDALVS